MSCDIRIGTSGFHYKHWVGPYYPAKTPASKMLDFYIHHFDTLELNNSFYRLPTEDAFDQWRNATPPDFIFAVKASRFLTHNKKLKDPENALDHLLPRAEHLEEKLKLRYAFEFREVSWINQSVNKILARFDAAFCIYELAGYQSPYTVTGNFTYVRLHGPAAGKYQGNYSNERLRTWAKQIESWAKTLKAIYIYFDNDQAGYAAQNALSLREMVLGRNGAA